VKIFFRTTFIGLCFLASLWSFEATANERDTRLGTGAMHHWQANTHWLGQWIHGGLELDDQWAWLLDIGWAGALQEDFGHRLDVITRIEYRFDVLAWVPSVRLGAGGVFGLGEAPFRSEPTIHLGWAVMYRPQRRWGVQLWNECTWLPVADSQFRVITGLNVQFFL